MRPALAAMLLLACVTPAIGQAPNSDLAKLQGTWHLTNVLKNVEWEFGQDKLAQRFVGTGVEVWSYQFALRPDTDPKSIYWGDVRPKAEADWAYHGIYRLEGGKLTVCYGPGRKPKTFDRDLANGQILWEFRKVR